MNHTITASELEHRSAGRLTALTLAIGGMWPDGHEAMRASDGSIQPEFRPGPRDVRSARWAQQRRSSPHATSVHRAVADMWPDEHEAMLAFGEAD